MGRAVGAIGRIGTARQVSPEDPETEPNFPWRRPAGAQIPSPNLPLREGAGASSGAVEIVCRPDIPTAGNGPRGEALAVLGGAEAEVMHEDAPEGALIAQTRAFGDVLERQIGFFQESARLGQAQPAHQFGGRLVEVSAAP